MQSFSNRHSRPTDTVRRLGARMPIGSILVVLALLSAISAGCSSEPDVITVERTVEVIKEVPVEVIVEKEVPVVVERVITKEVPVEVMVIREVVREVSVEVVVEKVVIKEVPVEVIREVEVPTKVAQDDVTKEVEEPAEAVKEEFRQSPLTDIWLVSDGRELYRSFDSGSPDSFAFVNMLDLESEYHVMRGMDFTSSGELWFALDVGSWSRFYIYDEDEVGNHRQVGSADFDWIGGLAFDDRDHLWFAARRGGGRGEKWHLHEIQDIDGGLSNISSYDQLDPSVEHVRDIAFHRGSLFILDSANRKVIEVPDPTVPGDVIDHGVLPDDLGSPSGLTSDGEALWISDDHSSGVDELWRFQVPGEVVEIGDIDSLGIHQLFGLAFNKVQASSPVPNPIVPPAQSEIWVATDHSLHKVTETADPSNLTFVGDLEGHFVVNGLIVEGIDFDSQGRLWIVASDTGRFADWHMLYRLNNAENPRDAVVVAVLDNLEEPPRGIVIDDEDGVWVVDALSNVYRIEGDQAVRISTHRLLYPDSQDYTRFVFGGFAFSDSAYTIVSNMIFNVPSLSQPHVGASKGELPEDARGLHGLVASDDNTFWGWRREGVEKELWRIADIEDPRNTVTTRKVGEFPEILSSIRDMAMYKTGDN